MTLEECFKAAGEKFPFKAFANGAIRPHTIVARLPGSLNGWVWADGLEVEVILNLNTMWDLYIEPKPKKKLYPFVVGLNGSKTFPFTVWALSEEECKERCEYNNETYYGPVPGLQAIEVDET